MKQYKRQWHAEQVDAFKAQRQRYEEFATFLDKVLDRACKQLSPLAIVQSRAKTIPSFAEKILRKLPEVPNEGKMDSVAKWQNHFDPINKFTDLCGARVITQTEYEVSRVCAFIQNNFIIDRENSEDKKSGLKPDQFNYLSVHYIVSLAEGAQILGIEAPPAIAGLKAEIQVRTLLQHAWASISHDSLYKINLRPPDRIKRDLARVAALLEAADKEFAVFVEDMKSYSGRYGAHLDQDEFEQELNLLDTVLAVEDDPAKRPAIIMQKVRLHKCMSDWGAVIGLLQEHAQDGPPEVPRELGHALCRANKLTPHSDEYKRGRKLLGQAVGQDPSDAEAWYYLAESYLPDDPEEALACFRQALALKPSEPYFLASYLEHHIASNRSEAVVGLLGPDIAAAVKTCRAHAEACIELPWCLFTMGRLHLMHNQPYRSLHAYLEAVNLWVADENIAPELIDEELQTLQRLKPVQDRLEAHGWVQRLLVAAKAARLGRDSEELLEELASQGVELRGPIMLLAGSCLEQEQLSIEQYKPDLWEALPDFRGTIISGGTQAGVAGLAGWLQMELGDNVVTYGYLPRSLPRGVQEDGRYTHIAPTAGTGFSPLQPLQMWLDILHAGVPLAQVNLLALGGGRIAAVEYRLALALGAKVGVPPGSGREADKLLNDPVWGNHPNLIRLVRDPMTIRALLLSPSLRLSSEQIETAARTSHEANRTGKKAEDVDPSLKPWDKLDEKFKHSSRQQKIYAEAILNRFGYGLRPWPEGAPKDEAHLFRFEDDREVEEMARMEHGRWNLERGKEGWGYGEEKDVERKITPYLAPWEMLEDKIKDYDRKYVLGWPEDFQKAGFQIYKLSSQ